MMLSTLFLLWISVRVGLSDAVLLKIIDRIYTNILRTLCESVIIKTEKENHRRAATPSQDNGITAYRVKVGRLFLFYGNNVASDENND